MRPVRLIALVVSLMMLPALGEAANACAMQGRGMKAIRSHDCCPQSVQSAQPACCEASPASALGNATKTAEPTTSVALGVVGAAQVIVEPTLRRASSPLTVFAGPPRDLLSRLHILRV